MSDDEGKYITRREGARLAQDKLGIPLSKSVIDKDAATGRGPKPSALYGRRHLYTVEEFCRYARERIVKVNADTA